MSEDKKVLPRNDGRVIIHFDYDCFYASVFEAQNPALRNQPFAVQQKHIIVTCNYEARRRGCHKLQLIRDAKRICPDLIIELGEDISRFRDASKELYAFLRQHAWSNRIERLGFDEVWIDVTDMVEYNLGLLNRNDLGRSWFQTVRHDPTQGFEFDAQVVAGYTFPSAWSGVGLDAEDERLAMRLKLGSYLAMWIRHRLEEHKGYTSTVGIATNKLLSKLVGNVNKPKGQTTLMPPSQTQSDASSNTIAFLDDHEIGRIPGIGFKLAQRLRGFHLQRPATYEFYGGPKDSVTVASIRTHPEVCPEMLEKLLSGPGSPYGIGPKVWGLLHGVDDSEVTQCRAVPTQISIEDSYLRLDTFPELLTELTALASSLIKRMRVDLLADDDDALNPISKDPESDDSSPNISPPPLPTKKWLAHPRTLRLTTRPRNPIQADGTRTRSFKRISHSGPLPNFIFSLSDSIDALAERLVRECLVHMFRKLHPERVGWNLSLVNLAVTNMAEAAGESRTAKGRDIGSMFRRQEDVLRDFKVVDENTVDHGDKQDATEQADSVTGSRTVKRSGESETENEVNSVSLDKTEDGEQGWIDEDTLDVEPTDRCVTCGSFIPAFAMLAHQRFHSRHLVEP